MYVSSLTDLASWFHELNHTNYARWIPVHNKDMVELPIKHPEVAREFAVGTFTYTEEDKKFDIINPNWLGTYAEQCLHQGS